MTDGRVTWLSPNDAPDAFPNDRFGGYHKVAVNALHPTAYLRTGHRPDRFGQLGVRVEPWRHGG